MRITEVQLPNNETLKFGNFNVFIGGNGVGKSTVLLELFYKAVGTTGRSRWYWINDVKYASDSFSDDLRLLKASMWMKYEGTNRFYHSQAVKDQNGNVDTSEQFRFSPSEYDQIEGIADSSILGSQAKYRRPLIALSSCDARLGLQNEVGRAGHDQPPQDPINVLYRNKRLFREIDRTIYERFKLHFILLDHVGTKLELGIAPEPAPVFDNNAEDVQLEFRKVEQWKGEKFTPLSEAGHGIRSMIRLLTSLLEPVNQVILIDEPEMHLYPSQKRWLGRQLVTVAQSGQKQVFLVTHDPMVLQGILDASARTSIFRVDRNPDGTGKVHACELERHIDATPMRNQDQYLQGLFYQRCVVVEGASDRSFYQDMMEQYEATRDKDLGFIASGGKAASKHIAKTFAKVQLRGAFIFDFDVLLSDIPVTKEIYQTLGGAGDPLAPIEELFSQEPTVSQAEEKHRQKAIRDLTGYKEKAGMTSEWAAAHRGIFDTAIEALGRVGMFIVPNGALESWAPEVEPKTKFAELGPDAVRGNPALEGSFRSFAKKVLAHIDITLS